MLQAKLIIFLERDQLRGSSGSLLGRGMRTISRVPKWFARVPSRSTRWTVPGMADSSIPPWTMVTWYLQDSAVYSCLKSKSCFLFWDIEISERSATCLYSCLRIFLFLLSFISLSSPECRLIDRRNYSTQTEVCLISRSNDKPPPHSHWFVDLSFSIVVHVVYR